MYRHMMIRCWSFLIGLLPSAALAQSQEFFEKQRQLLQLLKEAKESPIYAILTYSAFAIGGFVVAVLLIFLLIVLFKRN